MRFNRRQTIKVLALGGATAAGTLRLSAQPATAFRHGVASGDPDQASIVLWTRVTGDGAPAPVWWEIARDDAFSEVAASGEVMATAETDFTVKVVPGGLEPGRRYAYRFTAAGETSPVGRTMTLPVAQVERFGIALVSCSNYPFGFFNPYDAIARDEAVDLVFHAGDYIYEYGADGWGSAVGESLGRLHEPAGEIVSLADYRMRHAQYKTDAGAQAMHAAHPFVACWDDHEVTNNPWVGGAQNHQPEDEGDYELRRLAALKAYYEWMPIREPAPEGDRRAFWRTYVVGDLATLITLETRHTGRGQQVAYPEEGAIQSREARDRFMAEVIGDPSRRMLSQGMEEALRAGLAASVSAGQPWRIIGNASPMARNLLPDLTQMGVPAEAFPDDAQSMVWLGRWNLPWYTDTWDGYPVAREAFYALAREAGASDLVVLTGDSHSFWANRLFDAGGRPMGVEVATAGVSSPSDLLDAGFDLETTARVDALLAEGMDEVRWVDSTSTGYVRLELGREEARATYVGVDTVLSEAYGTVPLRSETIRRMEAGIDFV